MSGHIPTEKSLKTPSLQLVIPFILGIVIGHNHLFSANADSLCLYSLLAGICLLMIGWIAHWRLPEIYRPSIMLSMLFAGFFCYAYHERQRTYEWSNQTLLYKGILQEEPQERANSFRCVLKAESVANSLTDRPVNRLAQLYVRKDSLSRQLHAGDEISFFGTFKRLRPMMSRSEFDYSDYLIRKGITASAFAESGTWRRIHISNQKQTWQTKIRSYLQRVYINYFPDEKVRSIVSALTLGVKDELSASQKSMFSQTGASHLLALSGLHLGFLCMILEFLLTFLWSYRARQIKSILIVAILWLFTLFVGCPPSLVRAAFMFSMMYLAKICGRSYFSLGAVACTAGVMLLFDPFLLFDVGFQLSFGAVLGIIGISPLLKSKFNPQNRIVKYVWNLTVVSLAAQVGVLPIVLYHFGYFPIYFLLTNLLAVPTITILLCLILLFIVSLPFSAVASVLSQCIIKTVSLLDWFLARIASLPKSIVYFQLNVVEAVLLVIILFCWIKCLYGKTVHWAWTCAFSLLIFVGYRGYSSMQSSFPTTVSFGVQDKEGTFAIINYGRFRKIEWNVKDTSNVDNPFIAKDGIVRCSGKNICFLTDGRWRWKSSGKPLPVQYLYVTKDFKGRLQDFQQIFEVEQVILDASLGRYKEKLWKADCEEQGLPFVALSEEGFWQISL